MVAIVTVWRTITPVWARLSPVWQRVQQCGRANLNDLGQDRNAEQIVFKICAAGSVKTDLLVTTVALFTSLGGVRPN